MNQTHPRKGLIFILILIIVVALGLALRIQLLSRSTPVETGEPAPIVEAQWQTYANAAYGFEIKYPDTWQVTEDPTIPGIHIYKKGSAKPEYLTHHSNFTHVSIYPEGIGTEGVMGETAPSTVKFAEPVNAATDHVLEDGVRWATYVGFKNLPASWKPWGYVWAGAEVEEGKVECQNGTVRTEGACDIGIEFEGSKTIRSGTINMDDRKIQEQILSTFTFIN